MDRKGIIIVVLAAAVLVFWQIDSTKRMAATAAAKRQAEELAKLNAPAPEATAPEAVPRPAGAPPTEAEANAEEKLEAISTPSIDYSFTNLGAGIQRAVLKHHQAEHDANVVINQFGRHPIGGLSERPGEDAALAFTKEEGPAGSELVFVRSDAARGVQIRKKFTLPQPGATPDEYLAQLEVTFTNLGPQPLQYPGYYVYTGSAAPIHQIDQPQYIGFGWMPGGKYTSKSAATFTKGGVLGVGKEQTSTFQEEQADTTWAGVNNQYFVSIVTPLTAKGTGIWAHKLEVDRALIGDPANAKNISPDQPKAPEVDGALGMPGFTLPPGGKVVQQFNLYTGPREYQRLKALGHDEDELMEFGMFKVVSKLLLNSMNWLHSKTGSYAAAIILLTICIRGLMWPLQNKATQSMKKMQAITPMMNDLKAKYKDDPGRMNQELMKLYKDYQINPLAGCLPMFVQIPVFFGFFRMLDKAVELRHAQFLWVHDLSQMDTIAMIPGLNWPLNVLPLCMAVTMLWQMSLSPKSGDPVQQRVFMFMPLIFIFFCYKYASALALYWTVQNIFSVVQLYITRKQVAPVLQKVSASSKKR